MTKMTALLLCGYRPCDPGEPALGLDLIDERIKTLRAFGYKVVCVLAGRQADEQLLHCPRIADCELAFDTNETPNLATNLKTGLHATDGEGCFVFPVEVPVPEKSHWHDLREEWRRIGFHTENSVLQLADAEGALYHYGFPLIVTRKGNALIREIEGFKVLTDTRLTYLVVRRAAPLAPGANSL
jgi:hypothetical protein